MPPPFRRLFRSRLAAALLAGVGLACAHSDLVASPLPLKAGARVLFVGNSLTGRTQNGVGGWSNLLLQPVGGPVVEVHRLQVWAQPLATHWNLDRKAMPERFDAAGRLKGDSTLLGVGQYAAPRFVDQGFVPAAEAIRLGTPDGRPWDVVVLQDYCEDQPGNAIVRAADGTIEYQGKFFDYASRFILLAREHGAQPVLYQRWHGNPDSAAGGSVAWEEGFRRLVTNTRSLASHHGIPIIPVGEVALELSTVAKPDPSLPAGWLYSDGIHPGSFGVGTWAYCFAAVLGDRPAMSLRADLAKYRVGLVDESTGRAITPEIDAAIRTTVDAVLARSSALAVSPSPHP